MENEKDNTPRKKRRVSFFKNRKKPDLRPFVRARKHHEYKKVILATLLGVSLLFMLSALLFWVQKTVVPQFLSKKNQILTPLGQVQQDNSQIKMLITNRGLDISDLTFASTSAVVTFTLNNKTAVYLSLQKDILNQLSLVEAIDRQVAADGKQAYTIDLRFNKPIVKF